MSRPLPLVLLLVLAAPAATADTVDLVFEARENDCPDGKTYCFDVQGDLSEVAAGDTVRLTLRNAGNIEHNVLVTELDNANVGEDTFASAAFFETETITTGEETFGNFTVPAGADGLYFWCDVPGHEQIGMWVEQDFGGGEDNGSPMLLWPAVVAVMVAAWFGRR